MQQLSELCLLVVDDDPFMLATLSSLLHALGVGKVIRTDNAQDALKFIANRSNFIDIVISDLNMPEMDGIQLLRHLSALGVNVGIILISGEDPRLLESVKSLGQQHALTMLGTLPKPVSKARLGELLDSFEPSPATTPEGPAAMVFADELQGAILNRALDVHYQPQVAVNDRRLIGVEALARWYHPEKGVIPPSIFIGIAEKHGMIRELTDLVFEKSVTQAARWRELGFDISLSVNFSDQSLSHLDLPELLSETTASCGLSPHHLTVEVTESHLSTDMSVTLDILTRMRLKGFGLSIDDFGTGFSSLEKLQQIPFTELKIDRSFVGNAAQNKASQAILESSINLARKLNIRCIAEGVEQQAEWDLVSALGCDCVQGFYIARPMPAQEFPHWARDYMIKTR